MEVPRENAVSSSPSAPRRRSDLRLAGRIIIAVLAALVIGTAAAEAGPIEVFAGAVGGANHAFGSLTPTDWRVHQGRGLNAGIDWYLTDHISAEVWTARQNEFINVSGQRAGEFRSLSTAGLVQFHMSLTPVVQPYVGVGVAYLMYSGNRTTPYGSAEPPDHAALMTQAGVDYVMSQHWRLTLGAVYGPARSTAEVTHPNAPTDKVDFHQLYISTGLRYRF